MNIKERELTRSSGKIYTIPDGTYIGTWFAHRVDVFHFNPSFNNGRENCWFRTTHHSKKEMQVLIEVNGTSARVYKINRYFKQNHL